MLWIIYLYDGVTQNEEVVQKKKKKGDTVVQSSGKEMKKSNILMILGQNKIYLRR